MKLADQRIWDAAQRRASLHAGPLRKVLLDTFKRISETLKPRELEQFIESGSLYRIFSDAALDSAFKTTSRTIQNAIAEDITYFARLTPNAGRLANGAMGVGFDVLNPRMIDAVRALDTRVITTLKTDIRDTVKAFVENGLRDGDAPLKIARNLRGIIGLAPNQVDAIQNYRGELEIGSKSALDRALRNRRYDALVGRATPEQIDRMVDAYQTRFIAFNAETNARTAALDSMKLSQRLTWISAGESGLVDLTRLYKRWVGVKDSRERVSHLAMEGEEVPYDAPFSNGQMIPGDTEFNCRCLAVYFERATKAHSWIDE